MARPHVAVDEMAELRGLVAFARIGDVTRQELNAIDQAAFAVYAAVRDSVEPKSFDRSYAARHAFREDQERPTATMLVERLRRERANEQRQAQLAGIKHMLRTRDGAPVGLSLYKH